MSLSKGKEMSTKKSGANGMDCKFCQIAPQTISGELQIVKTCIKDPEHVQPIEDKSMCINCSHFKPKYIQYPITVTKIENEDPSKFEPLDCHRPGQVVLLELCVDGETAKKEKFPGILIGEMPLFLTSTYNEKTGVLTNRLVPNPAIWVPALGKVVYGAECWWQPVKDFRLLDKLGSTADFAWLASYVKEYGFTGKKGAASEDSTEK